MQCCPSASEARLAVLGRNKSVHIKSPKEAETPNRSRADLRDLVIGPEAPWRLGDLIETARLHMQPRNFAEHYLVAEMAISRWRGMRVQIMEKAVYDRQQTTSKPRGGTDANGKPSEPFE